MVQSRYDVCNDPPLFSRHLSLGTHTDPAVDARVFLTLTCDAHHDDARPRTKVLASECVTYSLCGHRIYYSASSHGSLSNRRHGPTTDGGKNATNSSSSGGAAVLPNTPLQYIEAQASAPHVTIPGVISSGCNETDYPSLPPCNKMHLYVLPTLHPLPRSLLPLFPPCNLFRN